MRSALAATILTALSALASMPAEAQREVVPAPLGDPTADELSQARARFAEGTEAAEHGRWADALGAFRQAYELSGVAAALYNVGTTYRSLGRHVDARDTFEQLLRTHPELDPETKADVQELRDEVAARVAALELRGVPDANDLALRMDGRQVEVPTERPVRLETEGGSHTVRVTRPAHEPFVWEGPVAEGDRRVIDVTLEPLPPSAGGEQGGGMSKTAKIILGTVIGLVLVGAGVTAGLLLAEDGLQPESMFVVEL